MTVSGKQKQIFQQHFSVPNATENPWDVLIEQAQNFLNEFVAPDEFKGLTVFEEEHPLNEREAETGLRNLIIYHTAGENPKTLKEVTGENEIGEIYSISKIELPEEKTWNNTY